MDEEIWKELGNIFVKSAEWNLPLTSASFVKNYFKGFTEEQKIKVVAFERAVIMDNAWRQK